MDLCTLRTCTLCEYIYFLSQGYLTYRIASMPLVKRSNLKSTPPPDVHVPVPLKRTESIIFELEKGSDSTASVLAYIRTLSPLNPLPASNHNSASTWVSLPPPALGTVPKLLYGAVQQSSLLGPSPCKLCRRTFPYSAPKPNLYRRVLIARTKKAAETMGFGML